MDDEKLSLQCNRCSIQACAAEPGTVKPPGFCPQPQSAELLREVHELYMGDAETRRIAAAAARTEAGGYCKDTRVEEIMHFARRLDARHLGIACCIGLLHEAGLAAEIFKVGGFQVSTIICKVGNVPKEDIGLADSEKIRSGQFEALCNPIAQARLLAEAGTDLNVVVGLCVGHDSLFFKHSTAPVVVLVAKDRVTGHNPAAALYTSHSYYKKLRGEG